MRNLSFISVAASLLMSMASVAYADHYSDRDRAARAELDGRIRSLNQAVARTGAEPETLHGISVETGVPLGKLRAIRSHFPKASLAGILVACVIANETKVDPEYVVQQAVDGRSWPSLALEYQVPFERIERRLARVERHIRSNGEPQVVRPPGYRY